MAMLAWLAAAGIGFVVPAAGRCQAAPASATVNGATPRAAADSAAAGASAAGARGGGAAGAGDGPAAAAALREADAELQQAAEAQSQVDARRRDVEYSEPWQEEAADSVEAPAVRAIAACRARIDRARSAGPAAELQDAAHCVRHARQELEALAGRLDQRRNDLRHERDATREGEAKLAAREAAARRARDKADQQQQQVVAEALARQDVEREQDLRQSARGEIDRLAPQAQKVLERSLAALPRGNKPDSRQGRLQDLLRTATHPPDSFDAAHLQQLLDDLAVATMEVEKANANAPHATGPPAELRAAARALMRADYAAVVRALDNVAFAGQRATATAALLLAAAHYALFLEGGSRDAALGRQAREDVRICRRLQPALAPTPKLFSPRFLEFFRTAG